MSLTIMLTSFGLILLLLAAGYRIAKKSGAKEAEFKDMQETLKVVKDTKDFEALHSADSMDVIDSVMREKFTRD